MPSRNIIAIDCETDPFKHGRVPEPFIWGSYDGSQFSVYTSTEEFVDWISDKHCYAFAHNGGRFDFMYLLKFIGDTRAKIIAGRIAEMKLGKAIMRDSYSAMPGALEQIAGKTDIDYNKFEKDVRHLHMEEIKSYLKDDCVYLYKLMVKYFEKAGKAGTIATNALNFARKLGIKIEKTAHRFDNRYRSYYFGGRTECFSVGNIQNINVFDIKSQYPFAMQFDMPHGDLVSSGSSISGFRDEELQRGFFHITGFSKGALPIKEDNRLKFPWGKREFFIPGWEFIKAKELGLLTGETIHSFKHFEGTINLKRFTDYWFEKKTEAELNEDKVYREICKRMLNSLYGKFAQNPIEYKDYKLMPHNSPIDWDNGWQLGPSEWGIDIHERPVLWRYQKRWGEEWNKFPIHYNVATAASITSHARSQLLEGMASVGFENVVYCDTDSIFVRQGAPTHKLRQDGKIGSWEWEGFTDVAHIAGKKLYALNFINGPKTGEEKLASKGAKLTYDQIALVSAGETIVYKREAPSFSLNRGFDNPHLFVVRSIRSTGIPEDKTAT